jgi:hypothetical protein
MTANPELEGLYDRVRLVRGKGNRNSGALCIMSFVALLAGERHTDAPATASPVVRQFALALNDAMPDEERQKLKPFAPRIIGTADGFDTRRATLLRQALRQEVLPRVSSDLQAGVLPRGPLGDPHGLAIVQSIDDLLCGFGTIATAEDTSRNRRRVALHAVRLLSTCAAAAAVPEARAWYWGKAIDLLDRLCDPGVPSTRPGLPAVRVAFLPSRDRAGGYPGRFRAMLRRFSRVRAWIGRSATLTRPSAAEYLPADLSVCRNGIAAGSVPTVTTN